MGLEKMWFGTEGYMQWIDAPLAGADVSPVGYSANGVLQNGGGFSVSSFGSHKVHQFGWSNASARKAALTMQAYKAGTYGRGLIYFTDPLTYDTNILPKQWADPSLALDYEAPPLIRSKNLPMTGADTANFATNLLPVRTITYDLATAVNGFPGVSDSLFIPVPSGLNLKIGAVYSATGSTGAGVYVAPVNAVGTVGTATKLTAVAQNASTLLPDSVTTGTLGVRIWIGKTSSGAGTVSLTALVARLVDPLSGVSVTGGPWLPGEGNSGCRFDGEPTYVKYSGTWGGQVGYAATLRETGSWEN